MRLSTLASSARAGLRWQNGIAHSLERGLIGKAVPLSFEGRCRVQATLRRALGAPFSLRAWERMTYNDKIDYRRLCIRDPLHETFCDKLAMRRYVAARLGEDALPPLLEVGWSAAAFAERAGPYVLKANHGSGWVILLGEDERLSNEQAERAEGWLRHSYGESRLEWGYLSARRLLLAEQRLATPGWEQPIDYRLYAFNGNVEMIAAEVRHVARSLHRTDWSPIEGTFGLPLPEHEVPEPPSLSTMLGWAAELSAGCDFVRVDLYDLGTRAYVGELTPYPGMGGTRFRPACLAAWLGSKWPRPV